MNILCKNLLKFLSKYALNWQVIAFKVETLTVFVFYDGDWISLGTGQSVRQTSASCIVQRDVSFIIFFAYSHQ